ncbi:hypothetical protein VNO77_25003 [Canavalia gladiata]|uniref:Uncharacterized protein n=1 Tax=Canavalia gladiata TaxID=3824 RepID=A0AAN9LCJ0_CANGL
MIERGGEEWEDPSNLRKWGKVDRIKLNMKRVKGKQQLVIYSKVFTVQVMVLESKAELEEHMQMVHMHRIKQATSINSCKTH